MNTTIETDLSGKQPATWYVSNGYRVVGPVDTELLLRGVAHRKIPNDCMVRQESWNFWRGLHQIREVSRLARAPLWAPVLQIDADPRADEERAKLSHLVARSPDLGESLLYALHAVVKLTGATGGLVHRMRQPMLGPVTSAAFGPGLDESLGELLRHGDPALALAREGNPVFGSPSAGAAERATATRLGLDVAGQGGVAMMPIRQGGALLAMIELARTDHPFRADDLGAMELVASWVMR
jgi:hypothetical protein